MQDKTDSDQNKSRLAALYRLGVLDSGAEKFYDKITQLTADICKAPVCLISLVDEDRQWFKSEVGIGVDESKIEHSICVHAVKQDSYLEIYDTQLEPRTVGNPLCQGPKAFRFYAGAILRTLEGTSLGTLCVLDFEPRRLTEIQRRVLQVHAYSVTRHLELTKALMKRTGPIDESADPALISQEEVKRREITRAGFTKLTPREKEVLSLIAGHSTSLSSKQIGTKLGISYRTVHHHRAHIMAKMKVGSVAELIAVSLTARIFN